MLDSLGLYSQSAIGICFLLCKQVPGSDQVPPPTNGLPQAHKLDSIPSTNPLQIISPTQPTNNKLKHPFHLHSIKDSIIFVAQQLSSEPTYHHSAEASHHDCLHLLVLGRSGQHPRQRRCYFGMFLDPHPNLTSMSSNHLTRPCSVMTAAPPTALLPCLASLGAATSPSTAPFTSSTALLR